MTRRNCCSKPEVVISAPCGLAKAPRSFATGRRRRSIGVTPSRRLAPCLKHAIWVSTRRLSLLLVCEGDDYAAQARFALSVIGPQVTRSWRSAGRRQSWSHQRFAGRRGRLQHGTPCEADLARALCACVVGARETACGTTTRTRTTSTMIVMQQDVSRGLGCLRGGSEVNGAASLALVDAMIDGFRHSRGAFNVGGVPTP